MGKFLSPIQVKVSSAANGKILKCTDANGNGEWGSPELYGPVVLKTGDANILASESGTIFASTATVNITLTLPAASVDLQYIFLNDSANDSNLKVQAATGDTIRIGPDVSAAGGYAESLSAGQSVHFIAIDSTQWVALVSNWGTPV